VRILETGNFGTSWDGSICDEEHIASSLEELGHDVVRGQRETLFERLLGGTMFDLILIAQWNNYPADMVARLRHHLKAGGKIVYWAFDYQAPGQEWHDRLVSEVDLYLSKPFADAHHPNWRWLSQDFSPNFLADEYQTKAEEDKDIDVLFTGSYVPWPSAQERVDTLKAIDERFNLHIYGVTPDQWKEQGFKNVHGPVMDHDLPELISRARINFSMDSVWAAGYWSDRNSQIMACGGFVLFKHVPMSEATFGNYITYFYNTQDCLKKIQLYLDDVNGRETLSEVGRRYATNKLMVGNRVYEMLVLVGGS
jgi:hypothetical protein